MSRTQVNLPYSFQWSSTHPHIAWVDIYGNGVMIEVAVVAIDPKNGDLYFIAVSGLDRVDRERLVKIIRKRDAYKYPLWDIMSSSTLKNGVNALEYFNQLVKVRSVSGQIFAPNSGKMGAMRGSLSSRPTNTNFVAPSSPAAAHDEQVVEQLATEQEPARRGPGRPPSAKK